MRIAAALVAAAVSPACSRGPEPADGTAAAILAVPPDDPRHAAPGHDATGDAAGSAPGPGRAPSEGGAALSAQVEATYGCEPGGVELRVRFDNRADTATMTIAGRTVTMAGQRPASGIWYAGDGYELRGKGRQARLGLPDGGERTCLAR